jgi:hypothetical protein
VSFVDSPEKTASGPQKEAVRTLKNEKGGKKKFVVAQGQRKGGGEGGHATHGRKRDVRPSLDSFPLLLCLLPLVFCVYSTRSLASKTRRSEGIHVP